MKQLLQSLSDGKTYLEEVPFIENIPKHLLIESSKSLISVGTEKMLVEFGKASYVQKARQQPDKVKQVVDKLKTDGLINTYEAVSAKLDEPISLGYSNVGRVLESSDSKEFEVGDRVVSNGSHAELVRVPYNLCAKIPDNVSDDDASFTVLGAIALQGVRLANPSLGEYFAVIGLGVIGLLAVQILKANGCKVLAIDPDSTRCQIARDYGAQTVDLSETDYDEVEHANAFTKNLGLDGVVITASAKKDEIVHKSAMMLRQRGRIVLVGVVDTNLRRDDFYKKEISFQVSSSYGPGRYDPIYELAGVDYPHGLVRWTAKKNFEAILELMRDGQLDLKPLISKRVEIADSPEFYNALGTKENLGILINYHRPESSSPKLRDVVLTTHKSREKKPASQSLGVSFWGVGNHSLRYLIPNFKKLKTVPHSIITRTGVSGVRAAKKYDIPFVTGSDREILGRDDVDVLVISTRHNEHAIQAMKALERNKSVYLEKPLALTLAEIDKMESLVEKMKGAGEGGPILMVGFNRRFSPDILQIKRCLESRYSPITIVMTINAGYVPKDHWIQSPEVGGGRLIGEACHFIDLARFLVGNKISKSRVMSMRGSTDRDILPDNFVIQLGFEDGSLATINYLSSGHRSVPKERVEIYFNGKVVEMNNFRHLKAYGVKGFANQRHFRQDKGHRGAVKAFVEAIRHGKTAPIPFEEIVEVSRTAIMLSSSLMVD